MLRNILRAVAIALLIAGVAHAGSDNPTSSVTVTNGILPGTVGVPSAQVLSVQGETGMTPVQVTAPASTTLPLTQSALVSNVVLTAAAGHTLQGFTVTITSATEWVMVFDAATLPSNGAVTPKNVYYVPSDGTGGSISVNWQNPEGTFFTGIVIGCSSTGPFTLTASSLCAISGQIQ